MVNKTNQLRVHLEEANVPYVITHERLAELAAQFGMSVGYTELVVRGSSRRIRNDAARWEVTP